MLSRMNMGYQAKESTNTKSKVKMCKEVFQPSRGRSGYSFVECYNSRIMERIKELYMLLCMGRMKAPRVS
jgi:hypothetical protein